MTDPRPGTSVPVPVVTLAAWLLPGAGHFIVDAGALSLSKDPGPQHVNPPPGMGAVRGHPELFVATLSQEHGMVRGTPPEAIDGKCQVGERIEIVPNHSCLTVAHFDEYHVVQGGQVVERWAIDRTR